MTPHRGPSRQGHCRDGPVAAAAGPPSGAFPPPRAAPAGLPPDVPPDGRLAKADGARVVAPRPHRPVPARKGPPLMVPLARYDRALTPRPTHHVARAALGRNPEADACVVGAGAPLHHLDTARPAGQHPGYLADLPPGLAARHPPAILRYPHHMARAIPARVRWAILARGSRPSRTAQPPLRAPVVGRELPSRKGDRGGTIAGTTGIASGFLTRITTDSKTKPPNDPILQPRHKSATQPTPRPMPAGIPWV